MGGGDIRAISAYNVEMDKINFEKEAHFGSEELYSRWMIRGDPKKGDVVMTTEAPLGNIAQIPNDNKYILSQRVILFKTDPDLIINDYFKYALMSGPFKSQLNKCATGTTAKGIQQKKLIKLLLRIPPLPEQVKIAAILSSVDATIEKTEAIINEINLLKNGLFHNLLTRGINDQGILRDPEAHPEQFRNMPLLGQVPIYWSASSLGSIAVHIGSGITPNGGSKVYKKEGITFIRSQNVTFDGLLLKDIAHIDIKIHESMKRSEVFAHDVLLNITGASIGRCCPMPEGITPANVNQHVCVIRLPNANREDAILLSSILASPIGQSQINRFNAGGNREGLNYEQLRSFIIPWPQPEERQRIARIIEFQNSYLRTEVAYLNKLKRLKCGLMHDLLTGSVRVKVDDHA